MNNTQVEWDQYAIKAEVQRRGLNLTGIALNAGLYEGACRQGIIGNSRAGAQAIADALDIPFRVLFPVLYPSGRHNENKLSTKNKLKKDIANCNDRKAS